MKKLILTLTVVLGLTSCQNLQEGNDVQATFDA
ncbi:MAG: lipoprotein, partial [Schleiferiaceae bacterium]